MFAIFGITLPIFIIIAVGFVSVRWNVFSKADTALLGKFVINIALPALLFESLSQRPFDEVINLGFIVVYASASVAVFAQGFTLAYWRSNGRLEVGAFRAMGMSFSNSALMGYPILLQFVGPVAGAVVAMCMLVETLLILPLTLLIAEAGMHSGGRFSGRQIASLLVGVFTERLLKNPLIIAIVVATVFSSTALTLPVVLARSFDLLAAAAPPTALFAIGGMLVGLRIKGMLAPVSQILLGKLLLHPLLVAALFWLWPPADSTLLLAGIVIASMPMLAIYPVLGQKYRQGEVCSAAMLATTTLSFFTISLVLWLLQNFSLS